MLITSNLVRVAFVAGSAALVACVSQDRGGKDLSRTTSQEPTTERRVDALMKDYEGARPGAAVLVLRDGVPVVRRGYGLAEVETGRPIDATTNFRLASLTKQFTAAAILLLVEDEKISLEDRIDRWLPELPQAKTITVHQLLTHTAGLVDYEDVMGHVHAQIHDADVLRILGSQPKSYFESGTSYRYSNSAYALLALIVERASGERFASFLATRIFAPLGMSATVAYEEGVSTVRHRAYGYSAREGRWYRTDQSSTSAVLGDGGIYSSIDDLTKWDAALYDDRLLKAASRRLLFTPATETDDPEIAYGYGWRITGETVWHSGETIGFRNVIVRYPERHATVVVLTNRDGPEPYRTALAIGRIVLRADARATSDEDWRHR